MSEIYPTEHTDKIINACHFLIKVFDDAVRETVESKRDYARVEVEFFIMVSTTAIIICVMFAA